MIFHFKPISILNWHAYVPKASPLLQNHKDLAAVLSDATELDTSMIPAMIKRRCSQASKIALSVTIQAMAQHEIDSGVFCSQHGELTNTMALFDQIQQRETLSPMRFSQSVHNTASGLFSICQKFNGFITSITAREQTFLAGVIEALTWLQVNPEKTLLLTIFDEAIVPYYQNYNLQYHDEYGIALLLTNKKSESTTLQVQLLPQPLQPSEHIPPALSFLAWHLGTERQPLLQGMGKQSLRWVPHD